MTRTINRETAEAVRPTGLTSALWKTHHAARLASMTEPARTVTVKGEGTELDVDTACIIGPAITAHCLHKALETASAARRELARIDNALEALQSEAKTALAPEPTVELAPEQPETEAA